MSKICFIGGARYGAPLDATSEKKFCALKTLGEIFVVGFSWQAAPRSFHQHADFYLLPGLGLALLRYAELFVVGPLLVAWLILRRGARIVIAQSPYEGAAAALVKVALGWFGMKIILVVETHGDFAESLFMQRRVRFQTAYRFVMRHAARFALGQADLFRTISRSTKDQIEQWMPGRPTIQFPAWTDIEVFFEAARARPLRADHGAAEILYTGVLIPRKGIHHLINAFAHIAGEFPAARLIILGHEENKAYAGSLKQQASGLGLDDRVQFVPHLAQAELASWMARARVFVLPSESEGLGRVVVEAMASGTPVIGSRVGGIPDMVKDGENGFLVEPGDEKSLAQRLRFFLGNPQEAARMGNNAHQFARQFYSPGTFINGYREIVDAAELMLAGTPSARSLPDPGRG